MSDRRQHPPGLSGFEAALASLQPAPPDVDRDELMFRAGQAAALPQRSPLAGGFWPAVAASLACLSLALGISLVQKRFTGIDDRQFGDPRSTADSLPFASEAERQQVGNELVEIRRYAYQPEVLQRRVSDAGIEATPLVPTRKRDQRRPW